MAAPPPPPPQPPLSSGNQPSRTSPAPSPAHAALPYVRTPVQDTDPPAETQHVEDASAPPQLPVLPLPLSPKQEDNLSDIKEKNGPVQETSPAPQLTEQQDEAVAQMDSAGEE